MPVVERIRRGRGEPLLLLHGLGSRWQVWAPLLDDLEQDFDVVAVDLPGFGASPPVSSDVEPTPQMLRDLLAGVLDELGWPAAHCVGNSFGGWLALELAAAGRARSVCGLAPAGLWATGAVRTGRGRLRLLQASSWLARPVLPLLRYPPVRTLGLRDLVARPRGVPGGQAIGDALAFGLAPGFGVTLRALDGRRFTGGRGILVPVTVAFGARDRIIPRDTVRLDELPPTARMVVLDGCGHLPMYDAPSECLRLIRETAARAGSPLSC